MTYFTAKDIMTLLPKIFYMEWNESSNQSFLEDTETGKDSAPADSEDGVEKQKLKINQMVDKMDMILKDPKFEHFSAFCST